METPVPTKKFSLSIGALSPKISKQLKTQGYLFDKDQVKHFEELIVHLTHIRFAGLLTDKTYIAATQKLFNKIKSHVCKKNKLKSL